MERPAWAPPGIDLSRPSVSRMYDYHLGGSHDFEVDREAARRAMAALSGLPKIAQANRAFRRRAVRHVISQGAPLVEPGLVAMPEWRPEGPVDEEDPIVFSGYAGVGRTA